MLTLVKLTLSKILSILFLNFSGIIISFKKEHPPNAAYSIFSIFLGIITSSKDWQ